MQETKLPGSEKGRNGKSGEVLCVVAKYFLGLLRMDALNVR
jgi:hypothetical protein